MKFTLPSQQGCFRNQTKHIFESTFEIIYDSIVLILIKSLKTERPHVGTVTAISDKPVIKLIRHTFNNIHVVIVMALHSNWILRLNGSHEL